MNKKSLLRDLGARHPEDEGQGPPALDVEKIKKETCKRINAAGLERKEIPMRKKSVKWAAAAAACLLTCIVTLNCFPAAAMALSEIPVVGRIVRVVTFSRYEKAESGAQAQIELPGIEGLADKELENRLNAEFAENAQALADAFEAEVAALKEEYGGESVHKSLQSGYTVLTDNEDVLALDIYVFEAMGSSDMRHSHYTIAKASGELLTLSGLFKPGADYISPINAYIEEQMRYANAHEGGMYFVDGDEFSEGFTGIAPEQDFYIDADGALVICFDKYEVTAGAQGTPSFVIPRERIADIYVGY